MRFLSVADRELRSAARQRATYRMRWITAALFFVLLTWLFWAFGGFNNRRAVPDVFEVFSILAFLYCLFISTARTADSISAERREGTLGFLFLTNLNSAEIVAGKLCSTALASVYGLMAIFPMLALPLLLGGITFAHFERTVLALLHGILFSLAAGFLASVVCKRQFSAIASAMGLALSVAVGLLLAAAAADSFGPTKPLARLLAPFSPLYTLIAAKGGRVFGMNQFWVSAAVVAALSLAWLGLTILLLARTWRDRPKSTRLWQRLGLWRRSQQPRYIRTAALRRRLLEINPLFWLAGRQPVSAPVFMCLAVVLTILTVFLAAPFFGRLFRAGTASPVLGHLFAWLWTGLAIHALVLYYAAMSASQRLAEDKQTGALELILSTPTTEKVISRGLWLAYWRKMLFPAVLAVLVHFYFVWVCLVMAVLDPPGQIPAGSTPGEIFWSALLDRPLRGREISWEFGFMLRVALLVLLQLVVTWPTLGWVGRWLGVRMKHAGFAPIASLALLTAPPVLLFSMACILADKFNLDRLPERRFLPMMMWLGLAIGIGHCVVLSAWASARLRKHLRPVAMSRYQPLPRWQWRLPSRRTVRRFALAGAASAIIITSLVLGYYGYQNWRAQRAWRAFQAAMNQGGETLSLAPLLREPVPDDANFARSPAFLYFLHPTNTATTALLQQLRQFELPPSIYQVNAVLLNWASQSPAPLGLFTVQNGQSGGGSGNRRREDAGAVLQALKPQAANLQQVASAAARFNAFQTSTNRDPNAVFHPASEPTLVLERLHLLFQARACALLAFGRNEEAAADVLTGLHLVRLARQLPDTRSTFRVQLLLARSLQPLWEGLNQRVWTEPQLAAFQRELGSFPLLADYTNAVHRVVLAHIELWQTIPDSNDSYVALPSSEGGYTSESAWLLQPRAWWFDHCIQLHKAGRSAVQMVDVAGGRITTAENWPDLNGLPVDSSTRELLQQSLWWGVNPSGVAFAQTAVNQAVTACALERFRLSNNAYPDTLDRLVPALLERVPLDVVSGRPLLYEALGATNLVLRGVGPNGIDERKNKPSDDWLWTYSTNSPGANLK